MKKTEITIKKSQLPGIYQGVAHLGSLSVKENWLKLARNLKVVKTHLEDYQEEIRELAKKFWLDENGVQKSELTTDEKKLIETTEQQISNEEITFDVYQISVDSLRSEKLSIESGKLADILDIVIVQNE